MRLSTLKLTIIIFFYSFCSQSQTYLKGNLATSLVLIPNFGIETSIGKKVTFQVDLMTSFWTINGRPENFFIFVPEFRYHLNEKFNGFYVGGHIGGTAFKVSKWDHYDSNQYQKGLGYIIGATIGYQKRITKKLVIDFFLGGGNHQGFYKGYELKTGERYDSPYAYNKSGEWIPYRGGVMLSYNID